MSQNYKGLFQDWEVTLAKRLIRKFQSQWKCLKKEDSEDLLQECLLHWYLARIKYNPQKGSSPRAFMSRVLRNRLLSLVREKESNRRKLAYLTLSLNEKESLALPSLAEKPACSFLKLDLKIDLGRAIEKLTPLQKRVCYLLREKGLTVKEVSECLKTPRGTIYEELKRIRKIFSKEGLKEYL